MARLPFALQLYTVRDHLDKDPERTLQAVKEAGYDHVELAGTAGRTPREFSAMLDDAGLTPVSSHVDFNDLLRDTGSAVETAQVFGVHYLAFSWSADSAEAWKDAARKADEIGRVLKRSDILLCYHNHAHEFVAYDGRFAFDILMQESNPENLAAEIDVYWVRYGGQDPVAYITKYSGPCPLLHIKDMSADESRSFAEVGEGVIDMPAVFEAGRTAGARWFIVEQDICRRDSLESARISAACMSRYNA